MSTSGGTGVSHTPQGDDGVILWSAAQVRSYALTDCTDNDQKLFHVLHLLTVYRLYEAVVTANGSFSSPLLPPAVNFLCEYMILPVQPLEHRSRRGKQDPVSAGSADSAKKQRLTSR